MRLLTYFLMIGTAVAQVPALPPTGSFVYIDQVGSYNTTYVSQDTTEKQAAVINKGDSNDITVYQTGAGNHTAIVSNTATNSTSTNSGNLLGIFQSGAGKHSASIMFDNGASNSGNNATITQAGGVGAEKQFTLILNGNGIGATVVQDSPTAKDTGSMSITCVSPPCGGYSYIRH